MMSASSGMLSTSSRIRASNLTTLTAPTLRPKLRSRPRTSFSMAMAFSCSTLRAVKRARRFWLIPGCQQRSHDVGEFGPAADQLSDPCVEFDYADGADLETEVAKQAADIVLDGDGLLLQHLTGRQESTTLLADSGMSAAVP